MLRRNLAFALFVILSLVAFWQPVGSLVHLSLQLDYCSHILIIPFLSALLIYWQRKPIFAQVHSSFAEGAVVLLAGMVVYGLARRVAPALGPYDFLSATTLAIVLVWMAGFLAAYGTAAGRAAAFPLGMLFLTIPIPAYLVEKSILYLQSGSTTIAKWLFELVRVPVFRQGFLLSLPGLTIEVAQECSSIRSSLALVLICLLAGYLFLRSPWTRTILVLVALPLSILKNGIRIVTLCLLGMYVDPAFLTGPLHYRGGIVFYLLALLLLFPVMLLLRKCERLGAARSSAAGPRPPRPSQGETLGSG